MPTAALLASPGLWAGGSPQAAAATARRLAGGQGGYQSTRGSHWDTWGLNEPHELYFDSPLRNIGAGRWWLLEVSPANRFLWIRGVAVGGRWQYLAVVNTGQMPGEPRRVGTDHFCPSCGYPLGTNPLAELRRQTRFETTAF